MSYSSGEAAEQVVRMTLNGVEVAAKISGKAAERLAVLLYAVLKDQKKTRGKTRLTSMLRSGKELKVFSVSDNELEKFCREAKKYGVLYCVLKDKTDTDGHTDVFVRAEDASKINRIFERFGIATTDLATARGEIVVKSLRQTRKKTAIVRNLTVIPRKRIRMKLSLTPCLRNSPTRKRLRRKTPQKAGMRSPVSPSLPQGRARKPTGVSLIQGDPGGTETEVGFRAENERRSFEGAGAHRGAQEEKGKGEINHGKL